MAVDRVQQCLAGLLTLDPRYLKQLVQSVLGGRDLLDDVQLLRVQDVQHVVEDGLQVARVQTHLPEHGVFLFWRENGEGERLFEMKLYQLIYIDINNGSNDNVKGVHLW